MYLDFPTNWRLILSISLRKIVVIYGLSFFFFEESGRAFAPTVTFIKNRTSNKEQDMWLVFFPKA
jgi:hypothetical protein